jgi:predicted secreted protein
MSGEKGGKDMLLKIAEDMTIACAGAAITKAGHGLVVGDLVKFGEAVGTAFTTDRFYFVTDGTADGTYSALDGTAIKLALTPDGTAITGDATDATVAIQAYKTIGGLRTSSASMTIDEVDVSNHGSNQWKNLKAGAGMRSMSISGSGVYTNAANYRAMENAALQNALQSLAFLDLDGGRIYSGSFKVGSIEASGEYDGEASFSMSANSSGSVSVAQLGT